MQSKPEIGSKLDKEISQTIPYSDKENVENSHKEVVLSQDTFANTEEISVEIRNKAEGTKQINNKLEKTENPIIPSDNIIKKQAILNDAKQETLRVEQKKIKPSEWVTKQPNLSVGGVKHFEFDLLLKKYVLNGKVNYHGLKKEEDKLDSYLSKISKAPPQKEDDRNYRLAYWINVYNAFTIKLILKHYPVKSITEIDNGNPWDTKWIRIMDNTYSLNQIEHEIIRPRFQEPRIHFAVNCAAISCPPLAAQAYTPENLESLLDRQTSSFINDAGYNKISPQSMQLSKIFEWYGKDFEDVRKYVSHYSEIEISPNASLTFIAYDWSLNNQ